jgi:hypothetical protein
LRFGRQGRRWPAQEQQAKHAKDSAKCRPELHALNVPDLNRHRV